ncbi:MAG: heterodisulfide reductase-related iron-sulfur binding cluster, partial [Methanosphaera sp.]|nr:heterodisulfide reductase-related iron-sulfur binding cluster [Methanosphaera sp.]
PTIGWYDHKKLTCGCGFRQRYANRDLSLEVSTDKFESLYNEDVDLLIVMCPNCHLQFDRYEKVIQNQTNHKKHMAVLNIAQLVALYMGADPYKVLGIQTHTIRVEPLLDKLGIEYDDREDKIHD